MAESPPPLGAARLSGLAVPLGAVLVVLGTAFLLDPHVPAAARQIRGPAFDAVVDLINPIGSGVTLLAVCLLLAAVCRATGRPRLGEASWCGVLAFITAGLIEFGLKYLVGRPRPDAPGMLFGPEFDSFPSGHATSVFAVAAALGSSYPVLRWPFYALATAIALGRVYLARHYLSDVIAGAVIGLAIASLVVRYRTRATVTAQPSS